MPIRQFPHCDQRVLHKPGDCDYCDEHPDWQELRAAWGINFTGEKDPDKAVCPSELVRHVRTIHTWEGNRPTNVPVEIEDVNMFDHLRND